VSPNYTFVLGYLRQWIYSLFASISTRYIIFYHSCYIKNLWDRFHYIKVLQKSLFKSAEYYGNKNKYNDNVGGEGGKTLRLFREPFHVSGET